MLYVTCGAAAKLASPVWIAVKVQVPVVSPVTVVSETEQTVGVVTAKATGNPDEAMALKVPDPPTVTMGAVPMLILWDNFATAMVCVTSAAAT